jgi:hypothetical protein
MQTATGNGGGFCFLTSKARMRLAVKACQAQSLSGNSGKDCMEKRWVMNLAPFCCRWL